MLIQTMLFLQPMLVGYLSAAISDYLALGISREEYYLLLSEQSFLAIPVSLQTQFWTILFIFNGIAAVIVYNSQNKEKFNALIWQQIALFFNFLWMILYFGLGMPRFAFFDAILLFFVSALVSIKYRNISMRGFYLSLPLTIWLGISCYLSFLAIY